MNPLAFLGYDFNADGSLAGGPSAKSWTLAGLQGLSSYAGTLAQIGATKANGQSSKLSAYMAAQDESLNASQEYVSGVGQVTGLRQSLAQAIGSRAALAGAAGVDAGQGMVADNARALTANNDTAAGVTRLNADILARRHQINALADRLRGNQAEDQANQAASAQRGAGILSALASIGGALLA